MLSARRVVVGVTGSIAAYKAADLVSKLTQLGATVDVAMTPAAARFIAPLTFRALSGRPVALDPFDVHSELAVEHVGLAQRAEVMVVAPASADAIARLAAGMANDMVTLTALATAAPLLIAPAMEEHMHANAATQANLARLRERGVHVVGPAEGRLASGASGTGRMVEVPALLGAVRWLLGRSGDMAGRRVVVTAGGTREPIDPVRYVGNRSSGKMGFALAEAARDRGAQVVLVSTVPPPETAYGIEHVAVERAAEMRDAVVAAVSEADALVMAAAVADFAPAASEQRKIKRGERESLALELARTPDVLAEAKASAGPGCLIAGFAAETHEVLEAARSKMVRKGLDLLVVNDVTAAGSGFGSDTNRVTMLRRDGSEIPLPLLPKYAVAQRIWDEVVALLRERGRP